MSINGFVNFLKPPGMTSHDAVASLRRLFNQKSIGHLGTLDPGAGGCLPMALGSSTRLIRYIEDKTKSYVAEMTFGMESNTGDLFGDISYKTNIHKELSYESLSEILEGFTGDIEQIPPMASSIKVGGKKLYEYFRKGIDVEIPKRKVSVFSIKIIDYHYPKLVIDVSCSEGTYIRSICRDIGYIAGCGAVMSFLVRTGSSGLSIKDSFTYDELIDLNKSGCNFIVTPYKMLSGLPDLKLDLTSSVKVKHGNYFLANLSVPEDSAVKLVDNEGVFVAIGRYSKGRVQPEKVLI